MESHPDWVVPESLEDLDIEPERFVDEDSEPTQADDVRGIDEDIGTFEEGELRLEDDRYVLKGASTDARRIGTVVFEVIFEGNDISPQTGVAPEYLDVSGFDYKLDDGVLHLRHSSRSWR